MAEKEGLEKMEVLQLIEGHKVHWLEWWFLEELMVDKEVSLVLEVLHLGEKNQVQKKGC